MARIEIVFETHSTTIDNERGLATGWLPGELSEAGRRQAEELGARRRNDGIETIHCSDLARAVDTAAIAFGSADIPVSFDPRLRECDYGDLNGGPAHDVLRRRIDHLEVPYPGGESWNQATDRIADWLAELRASTTTRRRILVIGHVATRWGLERAVDGADLAELAAEPFVWRPGWTYVVG